MKTVNLISFSIALALLNSPVSKAADLSTSKCAKESNYPVISKSELQDVVENKSALIIDVNSEKSYQKIHVPGAIHFGSHSKDLTDLLPKEKTSLIVAYCGGVKCGAWKKAAEEACNNGYTNIRHFKEGIQGWVASNQAKP